MVEPVVQGGGLAVTLATGCLVGGLSGWVASTLEKGRVPHLGANIGLGVLGAISAAGLLPLLGIGFGGGLLGGLLATTAGAVCMLLATGPVRGA